MAYTPTAQLDLGELIPTFAAPASCNTDSTYFYTEDGTFFYQLGPTDPSFLGLGCLPPKWVIDGYYTSGPCPTGYSPACSSTTSDFATTVCCPMQSKASFGCAGTVRYSRFGCASGFHGTVILDTATGLGADGVGKTLTQMTETYGALWAYSIRVQNAVATIAASTTSTTSTAIVNISSPATTDNALPTAAPNSRSAPGLSRGAKAGIAVAAVASAVLIIVVILLTYRRQRRQKRSEEYHVSPSKIQEHSQQTNFANSVVYEMPAGHGLAEVVSGHHGAWEMSARHGVSELSTR
ncbi:hypothetical protein F5Y19DRAFT_428604 [Xylariaceae sp. FL1651]|nr:hypothetical protein F5Y19DRAFT_428604 [Xylariaceae sp. FL1651]